MNQEWEEEGQRVRERRREGGGTDSGAGRGGTEDQRHPRAGSLPVRLRGRCSSQAPGAPLCCPLKAPPLTLPRLSSCPVPDRGGGGR